ncbi:MAG: TolC family protein [Candidatus Aminicenantes bacterium]|nr:TolC family protein [Candidatus Aminicenantes bacterium]
MKKHIKVSLALFGLIFYFLGSQIALAQSEGKKGKMVLTLEESLRLALEKNPFYLANKEKIAEAIASVREAASRFMPSLNMQGTHTLDEKLFVLEFPSFVPGQPAQRVSIDFTRDYQVGFSFSLPLFTGGKLVAGFKQAEYNLRATEQSVEQSRIDTIYNVKRAFYSYLLAQQFVEVSQEAVNLAQKYLDNVRRLYEVGLASRFDLLRSEVQLANLKPQLLRAQNQLELAAVHLKQLLGIDLDTEIEVKGELAYIPVEINPEKLLAQALIFRPDLAQLRYQQQMVGELLRLARATDRPTIAIGGSYNFWANYLNFKRNNWQSYYSFNLVISLPIFNGFSGSAQAAKANAMLRSLELTERGLIELIKAEIKQAWLNLLQAKETLLSQEKNVEQAQESLRLAELNYNEGLATFLDVSSAQVALTQARTNYSQALFDYVMALAQLEKAMGRTLDELAVKS